MQPKQRCLLAVLLIAWVYGLATSTAQGQLVAYWKLDESAGTIAYDSAGTSHGFFVGYPIWDPAGGVHGGCVYFHGDIEKIVAPLDCEEYINGAYRESDDYDDHLDTGSGPFTISCWFKLDGGWTVEYQYILSKNYSFRLYRNDIASTLRWRTNYGRWRNSDAEVDDGNWWFAAGMYDGADHHRFYLAQTFEDLATPEREWYDNGGLYPDGTGWAFAIGGNTYTGYNYHQRGMVGWVDEVSYWGLELNQDQLKQLFLYGVDRVNIPPVVDAGPPALIGHLIDIFTPAVFQIHGKVIDKSVFGPNELTHKWVQTEGPLLHMAPSHPNGFEPNEFVLKPKVFMNIAQYYTLVLTASDGVYEVNDSVRFDVRPVGWTGEVIKYSFDGDLLDSGADSEINDYMEARRYLGIKELTQNPEYYQVIPDYAPGIVGQAVHLKNVPLPNWIDPYLVQPQPKFSGIMLQSASTLETALYGYGTWTIEAFIRPDPGMELVGRFIHLTEEDPCPPWAWCPDIIYDIDETWYMCIDTDMYQFGGIFWQSNDVPINMRSGYDYGFEGVLTLPQQWHHVAFTGDGYKITLWVNGFDVWSKPYDGTLQDSLFYENGLTISYILANRSYQGLIDELKINLMAFGKDYMKTRVLLIPLALVSPADGFQYAPVNHPLRWKLIKGPVENPQYEVYLGTDPDNLSLAATTGNLFYTPTLDYDTTYYWYVKPFPEGTASKIRSFKTADNDCGMIPADRTGADQVPDCYVNMLDFAGLFNYWLLCSNPADNSCIPGLHLPFDLTGPAAWPDGYVNLLDFAEFASYWLSCNQPGDSNCTWTPEK